MHLKRQWIVIRYIIGINKAIIVVRVYAVMIIWIIATYLPSGICLLGVGGGSAGAGCVECFGFAMCIYHSGVIYCTLVSLLFTLGFFRILLWWSRY